MDEIKSKLKISDIYKIYTGDSLRKIILSTAVATALIAAIWYRSTLTLHMAVHYIIFFLVLYIKATEMCGIYLKNLFIDNAAKKNGNTFFKCIPQIKKIYQKGYIINHFIILSAIFTALMISAAIISALTGNISTITESFKLFSSYTLIITLFSFIQGIGDNAIRALCIIIAGFGAVILALITTDLSQMIMLIIFIISVAATPFALYAATNTIGKEYD